MYVCYPPVSEASREVTNLTERKCSYHIYGVKEFVSICYLPTRFGFVSYFSSKIKGLWFEYSLIYSSIQLFFCGNCSSNDAPRWRHFANNTLPLTPESFVQQPTSSFFQTAFKMTTHCRVVAGAVSTKNNCILLICYSYYLRQVPIQGKWVIMKPLAKVVAYWNPS